MATTKAPRKNKKIKRPDLKIGIKDFGPIVKGEIELKPLTVFIGPNNSGKTYIAMLIHSLYESYNPKSLGDIPLSHLLPVIDKLSKQRKDFEHFLLDLVTSLNNLKAGDKWQIPNDIWKKITFEEVKQISETKLNRNIEHSYACQLNDLVTFGKAEFSFNIEYDSNDIQLIYHDGKIIMREFQQADQDMDVNVRVSEITPNILYEKKKVFNFISKEGEIFGDAKNDDEVMRVSMNLMAFHFGRFINKMMQCFSLSCHFLPAARSDKLLLYKIVAGSVFRQATSFSIEKEQATPKLLGVASDFISSIIEILPEKKGYFYQFAGELAMELFGGEIIFESEDVNPFPEVKYRFQGVDIPLQRASSSVSEIAPLILYLKYIVQPGSVLIIEEPEAHLHPGNQRILAKYLVRLVRQGVNVLITTHSDYLLEQINNFYLLSKKTPEERVENYKYDENDFIKSDEFGVYEFHYDEEAKGYKIKQAEIDEDGILEMEIYNTTEALYEETSQLQREFDDEV